MKKISKKSFFVLIHDLSHKASFEGEI